MSNRLKTAVQVMIGSNVPTHPSRGGLATLFQHADALDCECAQTYITLSRRWSVANLRSEEISSFESAWLNSSVKEVVAHVPLIVNLASPADDIWQKSRERLSVELSRANDLGIHFLVLHPGYCSGSDRKTGVERLIGGLRNVLGTVGNATAKILLETMAGQGTAIGFRFEEIAYILDELEKKEVLGVCFDTCHAFASGYDIRGYDGYEAVLKEFDATVGLNRIKAIHLNDSKAELGSKIDRHIAIGTGKMGLQVFHAFVREPRFRDTPMVIELPSRNREVIQQQLELLRKMQTTPDSISEPKDIRSQLRLDKVFSNPQS